MGSAPIEGVRKTFPDGVAFQKNWRTYQARLLDRLESYLDDKRLHIVAAPGSGKTVFGLEVVRRINQPTLVLAPTITIRNQWVDRLVDHFLPPGQSCPSWVSTDLKHPALLTVATYQALHALCSGELDKESEQISDEDDRDHSLENNHEHANENGRSETVIQLPEILTKAGLRTLVLDEAHHLRTEWWKTLTFVAGRLADPTIVALTATPPYDVSPFEWQRYQELCGPVDAEVSVPELVLRCDLCPHQDYVYFSTPAEKEQKTLSDFRQAVDQFVQRLQANQAFTTALVVHPWLMSPATQVEQILEDPQYLSSMVVYLRAAGEEISPDVLETLGLPGKRVPALDLEWLEVLLSHCLYSDAESFSGSEALFKSLRHELFAIGAIERHKVKLRNPSDHTRLLTASTTKLKSIEEIVRLEAEAQGSELRCVILTDFIRKAEMPKNGAETALFEDIGIVPIFESLRRAPLSNLRLGVLSGSIVMIPAESEPLLRQVAKALQIRPGDLSVKPLAFDSNDSVVELHAEYHQGIVRLLTAVFEKGGITVLVGTKSLLGEGWDAPSINTLILASFVGSYMLSNQMRGRSIRIDPSHPEKTANIWHLVCIEPGAFGPGEDYELLTRRCSAFAGVNAIAPRIENGTERLGFGDPPFTREQIVQTNAQTCARALDRAGLRRRWEEALAAGTMKEMAAGIKAPEEALPRGFILANTIASLLMQAWFIFVLFFSEVMRWPVRTASMQGFFTDTSVIAAIGAAISLPWTLRALWRFIRHGTPERSVRQIGQAVLEALKCEGSINRRAGEFRI